MKVSVDKWGARAWHLGPRKENPMMYSETVKTEEVVRISSILESAMDACRHDFSRQVASFDFCMVCPLLKPCVMQEKATATHKEGV